MPGARGNVIPVKPITGFLKEWYAFVKRVAWGKPGKVGFCPVLAPEVLNFVWRYITGCARTLHHRPRVWSGICFQTEMTFSQTIPKQCGTSSEKTLEERGINIHYQYRVVCVRGPHIDFHEW